MVMPRKSKGPPWKLRASNSVSVEGSTMIRLVPGLEVPENPTPVWPECDVMLPRMRTPGIKASAL